MCTFALQSASNARRMMHFFFRDPTCVAVNSAGFIFTSDNKATMQQGFQILRDVDCDCVMQPQLHDGCTDA